MSAGYLRQCSRKDRHPNRDSADRHRRHLAASKGIRADQMNVYRCNQCGCWHVGNPGAKRGRGRKKR